MTRGASLFVRGASSYPPGPGAATIDVRVVDGVIDAIGPETFTYRELVRTIAEEIGKKRFIVSVPPSVGHIVGWLLGKCVGDVVLTRDEIKGLMADLLAVDSPPAGETKLTDWIRKHADSLGRQYTSELARRKDTTGEYRSN